jgi:16S rRNA (uracil1498-N3)-methyltransferase
MQKCFCGAGIAIGVVPLSKEESHHLCNVLRMRVGEDVVVLDGRGTVGRGKLSVVDGKRATVEVGEMTKFEKPRPRITLLQAAIAGGHNGDIVRGATALGADEIVFFEARRGECRIEGKVDRVVDRWKAIAVEACKQSGNPFLPTISHRLGLETVDTAGFGTKIFGSLGQNSIPLRTLLKNSFEWQAICVAIGPEGDFTPEEYDLLATLGFTGCRLARHVLRSEMAALQAVGLLAHLTDDRRPVR